MKRTTILIILCLITMMVPAVHPAPACAQTDNDECLDCHDDEELISEDGRFVGVLTDWFNASAHADEACVDCHTAAGDYEDYPHYERYTPVNCADCHDDAVETLEINPHGMSRRNGNGDAPGCLSCHAAEENAHRITAVGGPAVQARCTNCHDDATTPFVGSVHEDLIADGDMSCVSCHKTHQTASELARAEHGCGNCHDDEIGGYLASVHWDGHTTGGAVCADCHGSHHVLEVGDSLSMTSARNMPQLCGECHARQAVTDDYVRLPISVPGYLQSVHGVGRVNGKKTAVCTDCHGAHEILRTHDTDSPVHHHNVSTTCGQCHDEIAAKYDQSVHGRAAALDIHESPTCTDCHDEHLIKHPDDPSARASAERRAKDLCGDCHTDPALLAKYGVTSGVVETYLDSYHGWAVDRGSDLVATCTDCHTVHEIRAKADPASSIHPDNVVATCRQCHDKANAAFAASYTHESALAARGLHGWVRLVYIALIAFVLGGMAIHNAIVARYELRKHFYQRDREAYVQRWRRAERLQHILLLLSFTGLAVTGFALRFPDSWWTKVIGLEGHESLRANLHRGFALIMCAVAVYHIVWVFATRRGRWTVGEMAPRYWDVTQAFQNIAFHLGLRRERPAFRAFDYTQKAEYWAVVWGTWVMALTGFVLWFPDAATGWLPPWSVRVSEVIHFYEAILAVSAIVIWHFFYVIFMPSEYPMSTIWINGRMPEKEWREMHRGQAEAESAADDDPPANADKNNADNQDSSPQ